MERNVIRELIADINWDLETSAAARVGFSQVTAIPLTSGTLLTRLREKQPDLQQTFHLISNNKRNYLSEMKTCRSPCERDCAEICNLAAARQSAS